MQELSFEQVQDVNGGIIPLVVFLVSEALFVKGVYEVAKAVGDATGQTEEASE